MYCDYVGVARSLPVRVAPISCAVQFYVVSVQRAFPNARMISMCAVYIHLSLRAGYRFYFEVIAAFCKYCLLV
jgi:hypothetical protein